MVLLRNSSFSLLVAIVFGAARPQTGVLILPSELGKDLDRSQLMEKIWPVIEQANADAPTHSRILPEMVEFLPYGTHIPIATKMTILRPACYAKFKDLIDEIYARFERGTDLEKLSLDGVDLENFVFETIQKALGPTKGKGLTKEVDLFAFGVDSLQGTRIRNTLQQRLELGDKTLGQNGVFRNIPSLDILILTPPFSSGVRTSQCSKADCLYLGSPERWKCRKVRRTAARSNAGDAGEVQLSIRDPVLIFGRSDGRRIARRCK